MRILDTERLAVDHPLGDSMFDLILHTREVKPSSAANNWEAFPIDLGFQTRRSRDFS
jgi:hypothetical protein